jgi:serine/threonine protein kinase
MPLSPGDKLGPYKILAELGAGGMGEVYRARDPRLHREVAIKVSKQRFSGRFEREACAAAALNHPNTCRLYDLGPDYLVMDLVEGETLAARLRRGALKPDQALALAIQIADALTEAHGKGVVHRDLKPANIMLGKAGAKVPDFGLAKMEQAVTDSQPTVTMTAEGTVLGTVQYMSPEQAQGKETDARSDIFSFGLVLYEMRFVVWRFR